MEKLRSHGQRRLKLALVHENRNKNRGRKGNLRSHWQRRPQLALVYENRNKNRGQNGKLRSHGKIRLKLALVHKDIRTGTRTSVLRSRARDP
jgi:hypothetical protein